MPIVFITLVVLTCTAIIILESLNGRFSADDFTVYYSAAKALIYGEQVYGSAFGNSTVGLYKYAPFTLLLFVPYTLFPLNIAVLLHSTIIALLILGVIQMASRIFLKNVLKREIKLNSYLLLAVFLSALVHIIRELLLGNINLLLLMLVLLGIFQHLKGRPVLAGLYYGLVILFKPYFLLINLPLIIRFRYKPLLVTVFTIAASFLMMVLIFGWDGAVGLHLDWFATMLEHNQVLTSHQTIASMLSNLFAVEAARLSQYWVAGVIVLLYVIYYAVAVYRPGTQISEKESNPSFVLETFILVALIPNLVITDIQHLLLTIPILCYLVHFLSFHRKWYSIALCVLVIFVYEGNSMDLMGRDLHYKILEIGFPGMANLIIVMAAAGIFLVTAARSRKINSPVL